MKPSRVSRSTRQIPLNSTNIRKQMLQFVDTASSKEPSAHPYGDTVDLEKAAKETEVAAFRIAAAEQDFWSVDARKDGTPHSMVELGEMLSDRENHWEKKAKGAESRLDKAKFWRKWGPVSVVGGMGLTMGGVLLATAVPILGIGVGIAGFMLYMGGAEGAYGAKIDVKKYGAEAKMCQSKALAYDTALKVLPAWVEMATKPDVKAKSKSR